eukprot:2642206-Pleurochrysis_carterae.AAC.1
MEIYHKGWGEDGEGEGEDGEGEGEDGEGEGQRQAAPCACPGHVSGDSIVLREWATPRLAALSPSSSEGGERSALGGIGALVVLAVGEGPSDACG